MTPTLLRLTLLCAALASSSAQAYDGPVHKQPFGLASYQTVNGQTIKQLRIGYETYGRLNAARDNVILINHYITGTSHAAGRYAASDAAPGYWDALIGAGKAIDTDRFFVIAVDALANPNSKSPTVVTTGPATLDPDTGKPYGPRFPVLATRDNVEVQRALLDSLGITKVHAVIGASAGAWASVEWASAYPERVQRLLSIVGPGVESPAYAIAKMSAWGAAVKADPNWAGGDYYGKAEPQAGLAQAMRLVTFDALSYAWADKALGLRWADAALNPAAALEHAYAVDATLTKIGEARAKGMEANMWLYTLKALQLPTVQPARIKARSLFLAINSDLIFPPALSRRAVATLQAQGTPAEFRELDLPGGHADALGAGMLVAAPAIAEFLSK
ncbi:alpha/beta fold hydrolase [Roseateles toxinivorans]|uniref:Probable acyltransferase n=1 Tax=Roseateles toxinivorans TaxID=270368 RepID=A0A4R6QRK4_9BURK|nr:homoserine O-acetyltransferase [Roseateles toxinivorans]TDP72758.1 homoserine O-acetyltransferase [Roseateles toxinivorans]